MKARVKATGEIIDVFYKFQTVETNPVTKYETLNGERYFEEDVEFFEDDTPDYWEKLKHQYVGMAMQGILSNPESELDYKGDETLPQALAECSAKIATALVDKLKNE